MILSPDERISADADRKALEQELARSAQPYTRKPEEEMEYCKGMLNAYPRSEPDLSEFPEYEHHVPEGWVWLLEFVIIGLMAALVATAIIKFHVRVGG